MTFLSLTFLAVSIISLMIQGLSLYRLLHQEPITTQTQRMSAKGLRRTSISRVVAAVAYVVAATDSLFHPERTAASSLLVFTVVQIMWQLNAVADVRLRHWLANPHRGGRHRR